MDQTTRASTENRSVPGTDGDGQRGVAAGALTATLLSFGLSVVAYGVLPARMRIHWSFGGPYYGPEFAPTWLVLAVFSVTIAGLSLGVLWIERKLRVVDSVPGVRSVFSIVALGTLAVVLIGQALLVVANL